MKKFLCHALRPALSALCICAFVVYFCLHNRANASGSKPADAGAAPMSCVPQLSGQGSYDDGVQTSVAAHSSGLILEFHKPGAVQPGAMWYRVGSFEETGVTWGGSHLIDAAGDWPAAVISKEGYVLLVYSKPLGTWWPNDSDIFYKVGTIDPYGGVDQSITWQTESIFWDAGHRPSISMNQNGVIVGVHEPGRGGDGIYYRVGHLANPAGGDFTVQWDSGPWGIRYETGINPAIAINNFNEVVAVHQVPGEALLHYRRGTVSGGAINFGGTRRYDNHAERPEVALLDSGVVLEVHGKGGLISRTGTLSLSNSEEIEWAEPVKIDDRANGWFLGLAANETDVIVTYDRYVLPGKILEAAVGKICEAPQNRWNSHTR
jgi:hypothetical protein